MFVGQFEFVEWTADNHPRHSKFVGLRVDKRGSRGYPASDRGSITAMVTEEGGVTVPFKSQAQRRKFAQLLVEGKISNETFEEWNRETGRKKLPERVARKTSKRKKTVRRRSK